MKIFFMLVIVHSCLYAGQTIALFQSDSTSIGPFPSNALTVADSSQQTGVRVNLPDSSNSCDAASSPSVCSNTALLNQLDGFSVNPRIMVCFSAPVDATTLKAGISLMPAAGGSSLKINQVIFDPVSNCAFAKPNQVLHQKTAYLLIVTNAINDSTGNSVGADPAFSACLNSSDPYCTALAQALASFQTTSGSNIVSAALFTTMSTTTWLEKVHQFVNANQPAAVLPAGAQDAFDLGNLQSMTWMPADSSLGPQSIPLNILGGVQEAAFGLFLSPNFLDPSNGTIPTTPTGSPISGPTPLPGVPAGVPPGYLPVSFHAFLPPNPTGGPIPVVIYGHGLGDNQFGAPTYITSTLAQNGFATLALEITGHGYGAASSVVLQDRAGNTYTVATPGRGIQLPGNSTIGSTDGCVVPGAVAVRDCARQTAIDLFALVRTIQKTKGLGLNLDPTRIYLIGQSFGAIYGTLFHALDSAVHSAALSGAGGTSVDVARLAISGRPLAEAYLAGINPQLLNVAVTHIAPPEAYFHDAFNDNYVFRGAAPVINNVPGAMAIQAAFEAADWLGMLGDALSYAPHLIASPSAPAPGKHTLFLYGYGDLEVPNPTESAVIRAADAQSSSWFFRFDVATRPDQHPELLGITYTGVGFPILPHRILSNPTIFDRSVDPFGAEQSIALAEQQQVASYFATSGIIDWNPNLFISQPFTFEMLFEVRQPLPEQLNFLQIPK